MLDLGPREAELLITLWQVGEASVNQVYDAMTPKTVTVNTIHSAFERLFRKGFVERVKDGGSFRYRPALEQRELISHAMQMIAARLAGGNSQWMAAGVADYLRRASEDGACFNRIWQCD